MNEPYVKPIARNLGDLSFTASGDCITGSAAAPTNTCGYGDTAQTSGCTTGGIPRIIPCNTGHRALKPGGCVGGSNGKF